MVFPVGENQCNIVKSKAQQFTVCYCGQLCFCVALSGKRSAESAGNRLQQSDFCKKVPVKEKREYKKKYFFEETEKIDLPKILFYTKSIKTDVLFIYIVL